MNIYHAGCATDLRLGDAFIIGNPYVHLHATVAHSVVATKPAIRDGRVIFIDSGNVRRSLPIFDLQDPFEPDRSICIHERERRPFRHRSLDVRRRQGDTSILYYEPMLMSSVRKGDKVLRANYRGIGPFTFHFTVTSTVTRDRCDYARFTVAEIPGGEGDGLQIPMNNIVHVCGSKD